MLPAEQSPIAARLKLALALLLLIIVAGCSKKEETPQPLVTVQTANAERGTIQQMVTSDAVLFPLDQAAITPKVVAPVKEFYVNRGSRVRKGQLLAVLENRDLAAAQVENRGSYEQAQAAYKLQTSAELPEAWQKADLDVKTTQEAYNAEQKVYQSREKLFQQGAIARKELDASAVSLAQSKAQYEMATKHLAALQSAGRQQQLKSAKGQLTSAQGKYEGAAAQLGYTEITSPITGVVTDRPYYIGETATTGTPLLTIMNMSAVIARAHIPQNAAGALKVGDKATITGSDNTGIPAKVTLVSPAVDPNSTTIEVWVEAPNPDATLRPGTNAKVSMVAKTASNVVIIPASALLTSPESGTTVMTVVNGHAHQVAVETGIREGGRVEITKGLSGGETVITTGGYGLPDNTAVRVESAPAQPPETQ